MQFNIFRLKFPNGIHIGDARQNEYAHSQDFLRSDTLYAAFTSILAEMEGVEPGYIPEYAVSSLFPFYSKGGQYEYFFPRPKTPLPLKWDERLNQKRKEIKGLKWISLELFEKLAKGQTLSSTNIEQGLKDEFLCSPKLLPDRPVYSHELRQRVSIPRDRDSQDTEPYVFDLLRFDSDAGVYFLCSEKGLDTVEKILEVLKDRGLGTDRNLGHGHFTFQKDSINIDLHGSGNTFMTLGLIVPHDKDEWMEWTDINNTDPDIAPIGLRPAYSLIKRGGWITTSGTASFKKGSIYMLEEGSVIKLNQEPHSGPDILAVGKASITLTPQGIDWAGLAPVLRCGHSIVIPFKSM